MRWPLALTAVLIPIAIIPCSLASEPAFPPTMFDVACDYCADYTDASAARGLIQTSWRPGTGYQDLPDARSTMEDLGGSQQARSLEQRCASADRGCLLTDKRLYAR